MNTKDENRKLLKKPKQKFDDKKIPEYQDIIFDVIGSGGAVCEVCSALGIAKKTFFAWLDKNPDLKEVYEIARERGEAHWAEIGEKALWDKGFNTGMYVMQMRNRYGWKTRDETSIAINFQEEQDKKTREIIEKANEVLGNAVTH